EVSKEYLVFQKYKVTDLPITIGKRGDNVICLEYENYVGASHCELRWDPKSACYGVYDPSINGTYVNGKRVGRYNEPRFRKLEYGDEIFIFGFRIIYLGDVLAINSGYYEGARIKLQLVDNGELCEYYESVYKDVYNRSPRQLKQLDIEPVNVEAPPQKIEYHRQPLFLTIGPSITMVLPMTMGILFTQYAYAQNGGTTSPFMYMGIITSVTSAIIGVFWALMNMRYQKQQAVIAEENRVAGYKEYIEKTRDLIETKYQNNLSALNLKYPSSRDCLDIILRNNSRLWENNERQEDFLTVRIGTGSILNPSSIIVPKERFSLSHEPLQDEPFKLLDEFKFIQGAPYIINLSTTKLLGIVGETRNEVMDVLVTQLATRYSYKELKMAFLLVDEEKSQTYKWLPHAWNNDRKLRMVGLNPVQNNEIIYYLNSTLNQDGKPTERFIVFVEDVSLMQDEYLIKMACESDAPITFVLLSKSIDELPNQTNEVIDISNSAYRILDEKSVGCDDLKIDYLKKDKVAQAFRTLSNYRLKDSGASADIPEVVTFLEMYASNTVQNLDIYHRWLENRSYESMKSLIGFKASGSPIYLDIHEKYHGPHGLVAGTTGSGKSEMLQTYILSLAINYHPHEVAFILIDYKGGGMAQSFEKLPHTLGVITNLGGNQTNRALLSINSEIKRRQRIFNENHIKHIDEYI
ncbi:MAG: FHA domain-containing protein, partial [Erysipelotrichaceae bacterium]|nr:FHA domain-containing protein [Erysipelotrichaceae bacterium]